MAAAVRSGVTRALVHAQETVGVRMHRTIRPDDRERQAAI
jgi:hypothetical protein